MQQKRKTYPKNDRTTGSLGSNAVFAVSSKFSAEELTDDEKRRAALKLRFDLQDTAKFLMRGTEIGRRLINCMIQPVINPNKEYPKNVPGNCIIIDKDATTERTRYSNLAQCDSAWTCPVCASRITEEDKKEVNLAYLAARAKGYIAIMVTYTQRHAQGDNLEKLMLVNQESRRWMKSNSRWDGITWGILKDTYGMVGGIINLEVTHGQQSWHPHNHELIFIDPTKAKTDDLDLLRWQMAQRWQYGVRKNGGDCDTVHGLTIRLGDDAVSEYIAKIGCEPLGKWSIESEMTKGGLKSGRQAGRTPFQLLYDCRFEGDRQAGALFIEFATNFHGRAHIRWSQGLRELLEIDEFTQKMIDEGKLDVDAGKLEYAPFLALSAATFERFVLAKYGRRADLLIACEFGPDAVAELLHKWMCHDIVFWC